MDEKQYDKKYGIDSSSEKVKSFHSSRRMFAIKENKLYLAPVNVTYSHAKWFELEGWMDPDNDYLMEIITRGYFDLTGVYFYKGYDFDVDKDSEEAMLSSLNDFVEQTGIDTDLHLYGGKIKQKEEGEWPPKKDFGAIKDLL